MKIEDVDRAITVRDRILDLGNEIRELKRQKACEDAIRINFCDRDYYASSEEKDEILDIMIKHRNAETQKLLKELKSM